ncbi:MAG: sulfatase [Gemmataceae bacterium]
MRPLIALGLLTLVSLADAAEPKKLNVLFIMADDLRPELGCYGHPQVKSPNVDALSKAGVRFDRAYCQYPLCCPSRTSLLTGRLPTTTGVLRNTHDFRKMQPDLITLPEHFKANGYVTLRTGKIFHGGFDDAQSWTEGSEKSTQPRGPVREFDPPGPAPVPGLVHPPDRIIKLKGDGESHVDYKTADQAIQFLQKHKDKPFFLGCGFLKPHTPLAAPEKYFDLYDVKNIALPETFAAQPTLPKGFPALSLFPNGDLFVKRDASEAEAKAMIQAYWACTSWMDWNVGRVIAELDKLGLRENTIIVFWGDHGYHLGEMGKWAKTGSLFEIGTRVPLLVVAPGMKANGQVVLPPVQSMDLFPTLCELCGLQQPAGLQGHSLKPLLADVKARWEHPAISIAGQTPENMGVAVRTEKYRYAEWTGGKNGAILFDVVADPTERKNLADDPNFADVRKRLAEQARSAIQPIQK